MHAGRTEKLVARIAPRHFPLGTGGRRSRGGDAPGPPVPSERRADLRTERAPSQLDFGPIWNASVVSRRIRCRDARSVRASARNFFSRLVDDDARVTARAVPRTPLHAPLGARGFGKPEIGPRSNKKCPALLRGTAACFPGDSAEPKRSLANPISGLQFSAIAPASGRCCDL